MADGEKPNLRPTKHITANGKTLFLHHNPNQPSNKSYIHSTSENPDRQDPFGIEQPYIEYSLNKQKRWKILSSSDTESESEQQTKHHLYQLHNTKRKNNCVKIRINKIDNEI